MSDVLLCQTSNDGDIAIESGAVELTDDFRTAAYLSLFGGNEQDDGRDNNPLTWWGNLHEVDPAKQYVSETEFLLSSLPVTSSNLLRLEDAARRDLSKMGSSKSIAVALSLVSLNKVQYDISIEGDESVTFLQNWKAASDNSDN